MPTSAVNRFKENPLITTRDVTPSRSDFEVIGVFNPAVVYHNGSFTMLMRVAEQPTQEKGWVKTAHIGFEDQGGIDILTIRDNDPDLRQSDPRLFTYKGMTWLTSISHLRGATSPDGITWTVADRPALFPDEPHEAFGIEDPRITRLQNSFQVTYCGVSRRGICGCRAVTYDFISFERKGVIFPPDNKDIVLFPEKIDGRYTVFHRPCTGDFSLPSLWIAFSENLVDWGGHRLVMQPRSSGWDSARIGCGPQPVLTGKGWLEIYHGADCHDRYCGGMLLLDAHEPWRIIRRPAEPFITPREDYERRGFMPDVVFPTGLVQRENGTYYLYYGAADDKICGCEVDVDAVTAEW